MQFILIWYTPGRMLDVICIDKKFQHQCSVELISRFSNYHSIHNWKLHSQQQGMQKEITSDVYQTAI